MDIKTQRILKEIAINTKAPDPATTSIQERPKLYIQLLTNTMALEVPAGMKWKLLSVDYVYSISPADPDTVYINVSRSDNGLSWDAMWTLSDTFAAGSSGELSRMMGVDFPEAWLHYRDRIYLSVSGFTAGADTIQVAIWYEEVRL